MNLQIGDKAPLFTLNNQKGERVALKEFLGKRVVLFFYPQDDTPTCTEEVCNLRDNYASFLKQDMVILGISPDDQQSHEHFIKKQSLPFTLLSDPEHKVMDKYGVWAEKVMFGKRYMGVKRLTFLINEKGRIDHVFLKVIAKTHSDQIRKIWTDLK